MVDTTLQQSITQLRQLPLETLLEQRYQKFRNIAQFYITA